MCGIDGAYRPTTSAGPGVTIPVRAKIIVALNKGPNDFAVRRFLLANRIDINATNVGAHDFFELVV